MHMQVDLILMGERYRKMLQDGVDPLQQAQTDRGASGQAGRVSYTKGFAIWAEPSSLFKHVLCVGHLDAAACQIFAVWLGKLACLPLRALQSAFKKPWQHARRRRH